jgi:hypothetical protein
MVAFFPKWVSASFFVCNKMCMGRTTSKAKVAPGKKASNSKLPARNASHSDAGEQRSSKFQIPKLKEKWKRLPAALLPSKAAGCRFYFKKAGGFCCRLHFHRRIVRSGDRRGENRCSMAVANCLACSGIILFDRGHSISSALGAVPVWRTGLGRLAIQDARRILARWIATGADK